MAQTIKINRVLAELDMSVTTDGAQKTFSMRFITKRGESIYFFRAVKTGLNMNLKKNAMRGVVPVNIFLQSTAHIHPVWIWSIVEFNGLKVSL